MVSVPPSNLSIERRWRGIQKIINHDLPNQLVVIQGLLQLLAQDESQRLTADGLEILCRLQGTTERVLEMMHLLKLLSQAGEARERTAAVAVAELAGEAAAEIKQSLPGVVVDIRIAAEGDRIVVGPRSLQQALALLLKLAAHVAGADAPRVFLQSDDSRAGRGLVIGCDSSKPPWSARALEDRLEVLLARELIRPWGGELCVRDDPQSAWLFAIRAGAATG